LPGTEGQPLPPTTQPSLTQPGQPPRQFGKPLPGTGGQPLPPTGGAPKVGSPAINQPTSEPSQPQLRRPPPPPPGGVEAQRAGASCDVAAARRDAAGTATSRDDEAGTAAACDSAASTAATCRDTAAAGCRAPGAAAACREAASSAACGHAGAATCGQTGELRWATMPEMTAARIKRCFEP
jgi:hypothetical protein